MLNPAYFINRMREVVEEYKPSRERSLAATKLDEFEMWLKRCEPTAEALNRDLADVGDHRTKTTEHVDHAWVEHVTLDGSPRDAAVKFDGENAAGRAKSYVENLEGLPEGCYWHRSSKISEPVPGSEMAAWQLMRQDGSSTGYSVCWIRR